MTRLRGRTETKRAWYIFGGFVLKRDGREPEALGKAILAMKESFPTKSASQRADLLENFQYHPSQFMPSFPADTVNGKK